MLAALMLVSKLAMEALPNLHLLGVLTVAYTVVYRTKALIPLYVYIILDGILKGFSPWWVPYLYVWAILWGAVMLIPKRTKKPILAVILPIICMLHGLLFGTLYAPVYALLFDLNFSEAIAWIGVGIPFDITHAVGNLLLGMLIMPLITVLKRLEHIKN